jgi:RNA polymerase sigma-70 factor, ECF subfamily
MPTTEAEFSARAEQHRRELHVHCYRMVGSFDEAEDLVQETLLRAWRRRDTLERDEWFRAWLYKIATNAFLSDRRKRSREGPLDEERAREIPGASTDHAARLDARDLLREVEAFVAALPTKQRVALVQRKYHDLSYAEIAANLRCSEQAARASVHEALRKLRARFGDRL